MFARNILILTTRAQAFAKHIDTPGALTFRNMASTPMPDRYKLIFFAPPQCLEEIKLAVFAVGAGSYPGKGNYTECCFTTPGVGQFRPGSSSNPAIGATGQLEQVGEVRCEMLCVGRDVTGEAVEALKKYVPWSWVRHEHKLIVAEHIRMKSQRMRCISSSLSKLDAGLSQ